MSCTASTADFVWLYEQFLSSINYLKPLQHCGINEYFCLSFPTYESFLSAKGRCLRKLTWWLDFTVSRSPPPCSKFPFFKKETWNDSLILEICAPVAMFPHRLRMPTIQQYCRPINIPGSGKLQFHSCLTWWLYGWLVSSWFWLAFSRFWPIPSWSWLDPSMWWLAALLTFPGHPIHLNKRINMRHSEWKKRGYKSWLSKAGRVWRPLLQVIWTEPAQGMGTVHQENPSACWAKHKQPALERDTAPAHRSPNRHGHEGGLMGNSEGGNFPILAQDDGSCTLAHL